ncbi:hypothetical protein AYI70_g12380 [Smittium culicis]|uniref:Uncharacterized protein n=1 Tax=Smittium culicis TaxID=133412 RepID=A0A1R1WXQ2_9FUNG|nr:hypothetical protein AYI70_g12380 [Smittium culicis]
MDVYTIGSGFLPIHQNDIVVNLPKNDFKFRYRIINGKSDSDIKELDDLANTCTTNNLPRDSYSLIMDEDLQKPKHC